jgi:hypothetical protein
MAEKNGQSDPKNGERSPNDPASRKTDGGNPDDARKGDPRKNAQPGWVAALPPEVRDALAGGRAEDIPERYRHVIRAYTLWLQKNQNRQR